MTTLTRKHQTLDQVANSILDQINRCNNAEKEAIRNLCVSVIEQSTTGSNRATAYNKKKEQQEVINETHKTLINFNRGLYMLLYSLPSTYYNKQVATLNTLGTSMDGTFNSEQERRIINFWIGTMPVPAVFRMFEGIVDSKVNNSRVKQVILRYVLNGNLDFWAVKYREKLNRILKHCFHTSKATALKYITQRDYKSLKEKSMMYKYIHKYVDVSKTSLSQSDIEECICFILSGKRDWNVPIIKYREAAKKDIKFAKHLPLEVAEGIRSMYHPNVTKSEVVELCKGTLSKKQAAKISTQARAKNVDISVDFSTYSAKELYIYVYSQGLNLLAKSNEHLVNILARKAKVAASNAEIISIGKRGIILDTSVSMIGEKTTKYHPIASALAIRDMLTINALDSIEVCTSTGNALPSRIGSKPVVEGDTELANALILLLEQGCKEIFVITDGYENAPAGRFDEIVQIIRSGKLSDVDRNIPITQLSVVMASETKGARDLSSQITSIATKELSTIKTAMLKQAFDRSLNEGINELVRYNRMLTE